MKEKKMKKIIMKLIHVGQNCLKKTKRLVLKYIQMEKILVKWRSTDARRPKGRDW